MKLLRVSCLPLLLLAACKPAESPQSQTGTAATQASGALTINGAGATFPYPIYSKWFDTYKSKTGVEINYQSIGSGGGIQQVKAGTVDFGASDAALSNAQLKDMPRRIVHIPTVGGAVALAYNLQGISTLRLTPERSIRRTHPRRRS